MIQRRVLTIFALALVATACRSRPTSPEHHNHVNAAPTIIKKASAHSVPKTLDRLEAIVTAKGLTVFARIDHGAGAAKVEIPLLATQVLVFGNPKVGTPLIAENRDIGLDLPLKAMAWEDFKGQVWLSYTAPESLALRFDITQNANVIANMTKALDGLTSKAVEAE